MNSTDTGNYEPDTPSAARISHLSIEMKYFLLFAVLLVAAEANPVSQLDVDWTLWKVNIRQLQSQ